MSQNDDAFGALHDLAFALPHCNQAGCNWPATQQHETYQNLCDRHAAAFGASGAEYAYASALRAALSAIDRRAEAAGTEDGPRCEYVMPGIGPCRLAAGHSGDHRIGGGPGIRATRRNDDEGISPTKGT